MDLFEPKSLVHEDHLRNNGEPGELATVQSIAHKDRLDASVASLTITRQQEIEEKIIERIKEKFKGRLVDRMLLYGGETKGITVNNNGNYYSARVAVIDTTSRIGVRFITAIYSLDGKVLIDFDESKEISSNQFDGKNCFSVCYHDEKDHRIDTKQFYVEDGILCEIKYDKWKTVEKYPNLRILLIRGKWQLYDLNLHEKTSFPFNEMTCRNDGRTQPNVLNALIPENKILGIDFIYSDDKRFSITLLGIINLKGQLESLFDLYTLEQYPTEGMTLQDYTELLGQIKADLNARKPVSNKELAVTLEGN